MTKDESHERLLQQFNDLGLQNLLKRRLSSLLRGGNRISLGTMLWRALGLQAGTLTTIVRMKQFLTVGCSQCHDLEFG